jgi:two-component system sensor histidine kinase QseC
MGGGSIQRRLVFSLGSLLLIAAVVVATATYRDVHHETGELLDDHLAQAAIMLAAQASDDLDEMSERLRAGGPRRVAFQVWDGPRLLGRSANAPPARLAAGPGWADAEYGGERWRVYAHRLDDGTEVQVAELDSVREQLARRAALNATAPFAVAVPLIALLAWLLVRRGLGPLARLGDEVARRGADDLSPIPPQGVPDEAAPLVRAIDDLLARLGLALAHERRLTADAAHELRTPLAAIRAQAQVASATVDDASRRHALEGVIAGCDRAARLMEQLLALARADAATGDARPPVDVRELTCEVLAERAPEAIARGVELELEAGAAVVARADAALWRALVRNLVDNALHYAADGRVVRVAVAADGADVVLDVRDAGPGVGREHRARLGERFLRGRHDGPAGSGLGLSIVARVAALHGGGVEFGPGLDGRGLGVRVRIARG